jgi:arsenate reductase
VITLYGIKNCDTVKKARRWLEDHAIEYQFHDFRDDGMGAADVKEWVAELGWETVVNKRSTTWKQLEKGVQTNMDGNIAETTILEHPTLIKRPLLDTGKERHVGFSAERYQSIFNQHTL